jgi:murein L,D-transpeptidase YafK/uncharacterized protein YxeA
MKKFEIIIVNIAAAACILALFYIFTQKELTQRNRFSALEESGRKMEKLGLEERKFIESFTEKEESKPAEKKRVSSGSHSESNGYFLPKKYITGPEGSVGSGTRSPMKRPAPSQSSDSQMARDDSGMPERKKSEKESAEQDSGFVWSVVWPPAISDINGTGKMGGVTLSDDFTSIEDLIENIGGELGNAILLQIFKEEAKMELWMSVLGTYRLLKVYQLSGYGYTAGPKESYGDSHIPEGFYTLATESPRENAIAISYPNDYDRRLDRSGESIFASAGESCRDGCISMREDDLEEIKTVVDAAMESGYFPVPIHIYPFRMDEKSLERHYTSRWYPFWENLKEGYDFFRLYKRPPTVDIEDGRYSFHILEKRNSLLAATPGYRQPE